MEYVNPSPDRVGQTDLCLNWKSKVQLVESSHGVLYIVRTADWEAQGWKAKGGNHDG